MVPKNFHSQVMNRIVNLRNKISENSVKIARKHDDFGPWNMIVGREGLVVIDFAAQKRGPCCSDVLKMLVFINDMRSNPLFSHQRLTTLVKNLLLGYGISDGFSNNALLICEAKHRISSCWHCAASSPKGKLRQTVNNKRLRQNIDWLLNLGDSKSLWNQIENN
jgi:hypothetical protein